MNPQMSAVAVCYLCAGRCRRRRTKRRSVRRADAASVFGHRCNTHGCLHHLWGHYTHPHPNLRIHFTSNQIKGRASKMIRSKFTSSSGNLTFIIINSKKVQGMIDKTSSQRVSRGFDWFLSHPVITSDLKPSRAKNSIRLILWCDLRLSKCSFTPTVKQ